MLFQLHPTQLHLSPAVHQDKRQSDSSQLHGPHRPADVRCDVLHRHKTRQSTMKGRSFKHSSNSPIDEGWTLRPSSHDLTFLSSSLSSSFKLIEGLDWPF